MISSTSPSTSVAPVVVRHASEADLQGVHDLARGLDVTSGVHSSGFLVDLWTPGQYQNFLRMGAPLYVAETSGELDGFLLMFAAHQWNRLQPNWLSAVIWNASAPRPAAFFFVDQIAVRREKARRGVGRALYRHVTAMHGGEPIYAEIVSRPTPNTASLLFHQAVGFDIIGRREAPNRGERAVVLRGAR